MEIKYLRLIQTIADEGNITNSADRLFLTQSALSHQLRDIEERLGFKIFHRTRNNWKLTREGAELYQLSIKVLSEIEEGMQKIKGIQEGLKGQIRISTECYSFYQGLPGFVQKMAILYPYMEIDLKIEGTHHPLSKLIAGELDMAIMTTQPKHEAIASIPLFEDEVFGVMHVDHVLAENQYLNVEDFAELHLLIHSYPLETVSVYQHFLYPSHVEPLKITAVPMTEIALEMVQANMGVICLPKWMFKYFKVPDTLIFKQLGKNGFKRKHNLVYRKEDISKNYIRDFIENIQEEFVLNPR